MIQNTCLTTEFCHFRASYWEEHKETIIIRIYHFFFQIYNFKRNYETAVYYSKSISLSIITITLLI